jgi:hypothetical protein
MQKAVNQHKEAVCTICFSTLSLFWKKKSQGRFMKSPSSLCMRDKAQR